MFLDSYLPWLAAALGLIFGSFLNVVIARLPEGRSVVSPGSSCPKCEAMIRWYDNVPIVSYLALRGHCRACRVPISLRYPLVEFLTALLLCAATYRHGWSLVLLVRDFPLLLALVAVVFIDLDHRIIPDRLSLGGLVLALGTSWLDPQLGVVQSLIGAAIGFGFFYSLAWTYQKLTGRSGLGGGDIKLLAMLGAFLGPSGVFCVILVSSVFGSLVGIGWALISKRTNRGSDGDEAVMQMAIPYGPFLVVGALYYYLLGDLLWLQFTIPT